MALGLGFRDLGFRVFLGLDLESEVLLYANPKRAKLQFFIFVRKD